MARRHAGRSFLPSGAPVEMRLFRLGPAQRSGPQTFRRIFAEGSPVDIGEPARVAEAVPGRDVDNRKKPVGTHDLIAGAFQPGLPQRGHWRRIAETLETQLQRARAAAGRSRDALHRKRLVGVAADEFLGAADIAGRRG